MEHYFTTYIRTKTVFQHRLKDLKSYDSVKIYLYKLDKLGVKGMLLYSLRERGEIWYDNKGNFKALKDTQAGRPGGPFNKHIQTLHEAKAQCPYT
jgi:hypothetical protein